MARFFINRPIVAMVISILIVLLGLVALQRLPVSQYPDIVPPMIQVSTMFIGATAADVEASVATPLEQSINGVENMIYMKSINANDGTLQLQVSFDVGTDLDNANVLTQNRVQQAVSGLPSSVKDFGVTTTKSLAFPLLVVTLHSPKGSYDNNFLSNYASINVNDRLSRIKGVGQVLLYGGSDYSMRIWVKPDLLSKLGLTINDIGNAIQQQNAITPGGQLGGPPAPKGTEFTYVVRTKGRLLDAEEFGDIVLRARSDGSQVRLKDVARIELGTMLYNSTGRLNGQPAAVIIVFQTPGTNALQVAKEVKATMKELSKRFPPDMEQLVSLDTTLAIDEGIREIEKTLFEAILLVILVVFLFLQNWRATLIPLITVPVSLIGTLAVFPLLGFSINTLTLLGLVLAIGIVVDDAIVVVEAVMHHIEEGMTPRDATLKAMQEVSGPVVAIALVLSAVFIPVTFIGGITGRLYQQFAITIAISVLISAFNALTLSPALAALLLRPSAGKRSFLTPLYERFNRLFGKLTDRYLSFAGILTRHALRSVVFVAILLVLVFLLGRSLPTGFVPEEDQGYILIDVGLPDAASLERTDAVCRKVEAMLKANPAVETYTTVTGYSFLSQAISSNTGLFFVQLKDWGARKGIKQRADIMSLLLCLDFWKEVPEATIYAFGPPAIPGLGTGAGFTMELQDRTGKSPEYLAEWTDKFVAACKKRPELQQVMSVYRARVPQIYADVDRDKVLKMGVRLQDVNNTLGAFLGGAYINDFNRFGRVYRVFVQAEGQYRTKPEDLRLYTVRSMNGETVPLNTLVTMKPTTGPEVTNRFNLYRAAEINGLPGDGYSSDEALQALEKVAKEVLPADMGYEWSNMSYQEKKASGTGGIVFVLALVMVFLILAAQYESWTLPFSVLLGTPFAAFGAFAGIWLVRQVLPSVIAGGYVLNVFAQIGLIMLIGLAAKNAILIVEFARVKHHEGVPLVDAAMQAAHLRFRPILMTSFAFIMGVFPLVIASGAGAEARKVMGLAVFCGLLVATILGVNLIPVLFVLVEKLAAGKRGEHAPEEAPPGGPPKEGGQ
jgi:hydrophobic/amphiphilic exporter-1 (mainly G- bacteria), HAE1 family